MTTVIPPLPPGWTEHKAPTGHSYFYHAASKTSTYTRPQSTYQSVPPPAYQSFSAPGSASPSFPNNVGSQSPPSFSNVPPMQYPVRGPPGQFWGRGSGMSGRGGRGGRYNKMHPKDKGDRPKSKRVIPGAEPWVLVTTRMGRKFIHNIESKISLWTAPKDVQSAIDKMPLEEESVTTSKKGKKREEVDRKRTESQSARPESKDIPPEAKEKTPMVEAGDPYAEVETYPEGEGYVTVESEDEEEDGPSSKRTKLDAPNQTEFNEEDVAWQLEAMAAEYGLGDEDLEEGEELPEEDSISVFKEMLDEYQTNPYGTWDGEMPRFVEDERYTVLPSTKYRKEVFIDWCRERIAALKAEKEKQKKVDPRIPYWAFLKENATPKLYWPEFKRKFKKAPEMKDSKLVDKDRERMYRDYILRIKASETIRENDLTKLLKSTRTLSRQTSLDELPDSILVDVRYVAVPEATRDRIIKEYLSRLPDAPVNDAERKEREEAERKARALRERDRQVSREQAMLSREEARARDLLREEEAAIERAKKVSKRGLLSHIKRSPKEEDATDRPSQE